MPSILRSVSPGKRAVCDGVSLPRVGRGAAGRMHSPLQSKGYNDEAVRNAYNEVLATDYGGKRVKRSKYCEIK